MSVRDKLFGVAGLILVVVGIVSIFVWDLQYGVAALLLLLFLVLLLMLLQRRQVAKLQERVLLLIKTTKSQQESSTNVRRNTDEWKRVLGLLNAQQISMEVLSKQIRKMSDTDQLPTNEN